MASSSKAEKDMDVLRITVSSTIDLLTQFESSLSSPLQTSTSTPSQTEIIDCPKLLRTSTTIIRAHTTKLSLLIITEPFTPTAIVTVICELSAGALPVLMSAVELCCPEVWSRTFNQEVKRGTLRLLQELKSLLGQIPLEKQPREEEKKKKKNRGEGNSAPNLTSTGVVWETCDTLLRLEKQGIAGMVTEKAQEYHDLIEDAISELQDWMKKSEDDDDDEDDIHDESGTGDDFEDLFQPEERLSKDNTELRDQLESSLKRLTLVKMLYKAIIKRRLRSFASPSQGGNDASERTDSIQRLDAVMQDLKDIQEEADGLAGAFYRLDEKQAAYYLDQCLSTAKHAVLSMKRNWSGSEDEFSSWLEKWIDMINKK